MIRARTGRHLTAAALAMSAMLAATGCQDSDSAGGTVTDRFTTIKPFIGRYLTITYADGEKNRIKVRRSTWKRCHVGDRYPDCKRQA